MASRVSINVDDSDPRDPEARCDRCGQQGTIARAIRHTEPPLVLRYCGGCWPAAQQELEERQREEQAKSKEETRAWFDNRRHNPEAAPSSPPSPPAWSSASRSWYDVSQFLTLIAQPPKGGPGATPAQLSQVAAEIRASAPEMEGPMPHDVAEFIAKHLPPSA